MLSRLHPLLLAALMGKAGKDGQLGVHPVVLQVLLQALHAGHAVVAVRRIADELGVVFADDDQNGDFLDRCKVNVMPEVVLEIPGAPEIILVRVQEGGTARCTDGAGTQFFGMCEEKAVDESSRWMRPPGKRGARTATWSRSASSLAWRT